MGFGVGEGELTVLSHRFTPSPFPPCDLRRASLAQDRGGKPSPQRGEEDLMLVVLGVPR